MGWKIAVILILFAHVGVVGEKTSHTEYSNISLREAIDSINAKLNTNEKLKPYVIIVLNRGTQDQVLAILEEILLHAKLPLNRKYASFQLFEIWRKTHNKKIPLILKRALNDSLMDIRMNILWQLHRMGEKVPLEMIEKIASGEGKEHWAVSIPPIPSRTKPKPEGELIREARDNVQMNAIRLLYEIRGKEIAGFLWELLKEMPLGRVWDYTAQIYKKVAPPKKVKLKDFGPGPWTPEQIREYERQRVEWFRETYALELLGNLKWLEKNYRNKHIIERVFRDFEDARDLRAIPLLIKVLKYNPRGINRAEAAQVIKWIEKYNHDKSAFPALIEALNDTVTDVQEKVADALVALGDTIYSLKVLEKLAEGKGKKQWTADWAGYMGLENMNEREIEREKKRFRDNLQFEAINLLGKIGTEKAIKILTDVKIYSSEEWVRRHAESVLEKVMVEKTREGERK